jgi:4-amino-4-deoxy-L-arabinose transferase-like glycosyltransferase
VIQPTPESHPTASPAGTDRFDWYVAATLIALWGLIEVIINPIGDFPLNDDWVYGLPVQWLVEEGRLGFAQQNALYFTQMLWGSLFVLIAGFSYTVLRISTLVAAAVGLAATYLTGREVGLSRAGAVMVVGLIMINPVFVSLANTFMTDVPFVSIMMLSVLLLLRGLKYDRPAYLWAGWATVLAAALLRQVAIVIPIGLIIAMAIKGGMNRAWLLKAVVPAAVVLAAVLVSRKLLEVMDLLPAYSDMYTGAVKLILIDLAHLRPGGLRPMIVGTSLGLMHLGLWMLPLMVLFQPSWSGATPRRGLLITLAALGSTAAVVTAILSFTDLLMPLGIFGNILSDFGTGILSLAGPPPRAPRWCWVAITWGSAFSALLIVLALGQVARRALAQIRSGQARQSLWLPAFLLVSLFFYFAFACFLCGYAPWVDRYLLPAMVLLTLLLTEKTIGVIARPQPILGARVLVSTALALLYLGFSVASTHDYLAWNRQRWAAALLMTQEGIAPKDIRGGYEIDHYYAWRDLPDHVTNASRAEFARRPGQWHPGESEYHTRYVIAFSDQQGFHRVRRLPVDRWLPLSPDQILVLERSGNPGPVP